MADYIPAPDAEFDRWQANWVTYAAAKAVALGIDAIVDIRALQAAQRAWNTDYSAHLTAQAAAQAATAATDAERATYVSRLSSFSQQIQKRTGITDAQCGEQDSAIHETVPSPVPVPTTAPVSLE